MAFYFFSLHIPFSFGGLSVVAQILHQTVMDLQTEVSFSIFMVNVVKEYFVCSMRILHIKETMLPFYWC